MGGVRCLPGEHPGVLIQAHMWAPLTAPGASGCPDPAVCGGSSRAQGAVAELQPHRGPGA